MSNLRKITNIIVILAMLSPIWAAGCSCLPLTKFDGYDYLSYTDVFKGRVGNLVFKGDVWDSTDTRNFSLYQFVVDETYKGVQRDTVLVKLSLPDGGNCTKEMAVGESWYIFTNLVDSAYYIGGCSWSHQTNVRPGIMKNAIKYVTEHSVLTDVNVKLPFLDSDCNCQRYYSGILVYGQAEGKWSTLDSLGGIIEKGRYSNGEPDGLWEFYFQDSNNLALTQKSGKRYFQGINSAMVSYGWDGKIRYAYKDDMIEIPEGVFTKEELDAINRN
jgi:hypothetical protein